MQVHNSLPTEPSWKTHPEATQLVQDAISKAASRIDTLNHLATRLKSETGTRLIDWVDRVFTNADAEKLAGLGFARVPGADSELWRHSAAKLPDLIVGSQTVPLIAIRVERLTDFLQAHQLDDRCEVLGVAGSSMQRARIAAEADFELWVVERHGGWHWFAIDDPPLQHVAHWQRALRLRRRDWPDDESGFQHAQEIIQQSISDIGRDRTCDEFFAAERAYWQFRNTAGQFQHLRQQKLGLGWANHDHHTYRSSRHCFHLLIQSLELLGLQCRERFYAGREAGWGAQVMEQPETGVVVFADVDLGPEEVIRDFAHHPLPQREALGTVGLWCALHGEAFLQAGMHHLECQFDFDSARHQLNQLGITSMRPFTDLPHLRQSFTVGERWPVRQSRIERALQHGWISPSQAEQFRTDGALGSHLEVLERNDGFKGFNPKGISEIILDTDPRRNAHA